jgi:hypothetical protein
MLKRICFCILIIITFFGFAQGKELTIIYTAETHGMIDQCDCPEHPDGGIYRRATLIDSISQEMNGNILVLDGGGCFAGGMDDQYTMGDDLDKERTLINIKGLAKMDYAAVCIGEDEFRFGINFLNEIRAHNRIPFLSCNLLYKDTDKLFAEPYIIKKINGVDVGIIGVTTTELATGEYSNQVQDLKVEDPIIQVEKYVKLLKEKADVIVLLSHLGDDETKELVKKVQGLDIVLNAHRWKKSDFKEKIKGTLITQFNYQGKKIDRIDVKLNEKNKITSTDVQEVAVAHELEGDPELTALVTSFRENVDLTKKKKVKLDLYIMSQCPYGTKAEELIFPLIEKFADKIDLNLYYIVSKQGEKYVSLHGNEELNEDLRQICVKTLKPEKLFEYILDVNKTKDPEGWKECAKKIGISPEEIEKCISSGDTEKELNLHYQRKKRLRVEASPTVYVNNRKFGGNFSNDMFITKTLCDQIPDSKELPQCQNLPECFADNDCWKAGYTGKCKDAGTPSGKCDFVKDEEFTFTVLRSKNALMTNEGDIINSTKSIFPGMKLDILELDTEAGKAFKEKYDIKMLPAYLFGENAQKAQNFNNVKGSFKKVDNGFLIMPDAVGASLNISRERIPGKVLLFISSLSDQANEVTSEAIKRIKNKPDAYNFEFHYLAFKDEEGNIVSKRGIGEIEENIRQLVVKKQFPDKYLDYVVERGKNVGSSYWEDSATAVGLDPAIIKKSAQSTEGKVLLEEDVKLANELEVGGDVVFFVNNQEVIYLKNPNDLKELLDKIEMLGKK